MLVGRGVLLQPEQAGNRARDPRPQMKPVGPALMQRPPLLGNFARRVPMLMHEDRSQFIYFLIGHPVL
jgi:hypothetical protein